MRKTFCRVILALIVFTALVCAVDTKEVTSKAAPAEHVVSILTPREYQEMGSYSIWIKQPDGKEVKVSKSANNEYLFTSGTVIILKAQPKPFHEVKEIKGVYQGEKTSSDTVTVTVRARREFVIYYEKTVVDIPESNVTKKISNGKIVVEYDEIKIGSEIYVTVELGGLYEIKDFKINGIAVNNSKYVGDVEYMDNFARIQVTEKWLAGYGDKLDIEVTTQIRKEYLILGLCGLIAVPLTVFLILQMVILNGKAKKAATSAIRGKLVNAQRMNTGEFISGLREGTISTNIDNKKIKEEIRKATKSKRTDKPTGKPTEAEPK